MEIVITVLVGWMPLAYLAFLGFPASPLNARPVLTGKVAEILGWAATIGALTACFLWVYSGRPSLSPSLTEAGLIGMRLDALSVPILCLVSFLGAVIIRFSRNYLSGDQKQGAFFKWLMVTLGAVISLVVSPGLVQFWLSWVLCSLGLHHLLVYFPDRLGTLLSARKKFVISRLGDLCLILAFLGLYDGFGTQDFGELFTRVAANPDWLAANAWIGWLIVGGALLKSAQFPFHTWLPDTMGTPTPVSALMHAGIINAGGYLVIRLSPLLVQIPSALGFLAIVGALTLAGASLVMLTQNSVKRALAFSTIAQMGFMMLQCGLGAFGLAALHLVAHSLYKAHAFLSSGSTVATLKQLEPRPRAKLQGGTLPLLVLLSLGMVAAAAWAFGLAATNKPGLLVFLAVLVMAVSQYLAASLKERGSLRVIGKNVLLAAGFIVVYLGLTQATLHYFAGSLPQVPTGGVLLQITLACALGAYFFMTIALQILADGRTPPPFIRAIYVHALNGFYLNTLANRMSRAAGLVPAGR